MRAWIINSSSKFSRLGAECLPVSHLTRYRCFRTPSTPFGGLRKKEADMEFLNGVFGAVSGFFVMLWNLILSLFKTGGKTE